MEHREVKFSDLGGVQTFQVSPLGDHPVPFWKGGMVLQDIHPLGPALVHRGTRNLVFAPILTEHDWSEAKGRPPLAVMPLLLSMANVAEDAPAQTEPSVSTMLGQVFLNNVLWANRIYQGVREGKPCAQSEKQILEAIVEGGPLPEDVSSLENPDYVREWLHKVLDNIPEDLGGFLDGGQMVGSVLGNVFQTFTQGLSGPPATFPHTKVSIKFVDEEGDGEEVPISREAIKGWTPEQRADALYTLLHQLTASLRGGAQECWRTFARAAFTGLSTLLSHAQETLSTSSLEEPDRFFLGILWSMQDLIQGEGVCLQEDDDYLRDLGRRAFQGRVVAALEKTLRARMEGGKA